MDAKRSLNLLLAIVTLLGCARLFAQGYAGGGCPQNSQCIARGIAEAQADVQTPVQRYMEKYKTLYARYGQQIDYHDGVARSDRGEIIGVNQTEAAEGCEECQGGKYKLTPTTIIDQESRRELTSQEELDFGLAVGGIECRDPKTNKWYSSTAFVVARNVIYTSDHGLYAHKPGPPNSKTILLSRDFDLKKDCDFNLKNPVTGKTYKRIKFDVVSECEGHSLVFSQQSCDSSIIKLQEDVPDYVPSLELLASTPEVLGGLKVFAVGLHHGVVIDKKTVSPDIKLIDFGEVKKKGPNSDLKNVNQRFAYTADTNSKSSGQPVIAKINGKYYVIGSHSGDVKANENDNVGPFNEFNHYNYATIIDQKSFDIIKSMAPNEASRIEAAKKLRLK